MLANVCAAMRIFGVFFGVISFKTYRPKVDYSKWLGPDWKPHYDGASMYVSNHTSWYEMFLTFLFVRPMPGFVAKHSVKDVPSVGPIATAVGTVFMSRNSNDDRQKIFQTIENAQIAFEQGRGPPTLVFPEAATTNQEYLIQFKAGAFASLKPVKPYINRSKSIVGNQALGSCMDVWHWSFLLPLLGIGYWCENLEMPVFAPNDYFWKNHWDGKDEKKKWYVFAEAVRQAMAECGNYKLSSATMQDKMEYKEIIWGKSKKKDD